MVAVLETLTARLKDVTRTLEQTSADTAMGRLVLSFPRMGRKNGAKLVAELGDEPARFLTRDHLAAEGGVVPVTRVSGKRHVVAFRYACWTTGTLYDPNRHATPNGATG